MNPDKKRTTISVPAIGMIVMLANFGFSHVVIVQSAWSQNTAQRIAKTDEVKVAGRTLDGWVKDLDSKNEIIRLRAAKSLGPFGIAAVPALGKSLLDSSDGVKYWAADHLGSIGKEVTQSENATKIVSTLKDLKGQKDKAISMAAAYALFQIKGGEGNLKVLVEKLGHKERGTACSAAEFLGKIGPGAKSILPDLEQMFQKHKDYHVRGACQNAIRKIKEEPVR